MFKIIPSLAYTLSTVSAVSHHMESTDSCEVKYHKFKEHNQDVGFRLAQMNAQGQYDLDEIFQEFFDTMSKVDPDLNTIRDREFICWAGTYERFPYDDDDF